MIRKAESLLIILVLSLMSCSRSKKEVKWTEYYQVKGIPVVEGVFEFSSPQARWSGPQPFFVHVTAEDNRASTVAVYPRVFRRNLIQTPDRSPNIKKVDRATASTQMKALDRAKDADEDQVKHSIRVKLAELADLIQEGTEHFRACLYPLKVRLVRADGVILERQGCRNQDHWARMSSLAVSDFLTAYVRGTYRGPASVGGPSLDQSRLRHLLPAGIKPEVIRIIPEAAP